MIAFHVIRSQSGSSDFDDVMTKQVPGVSGANFVGRHELSVPKRFRGSDSKHLQVSVKAWIFIT